MTAASAIREAVEAAKSDPGGPYPEVDPRIEALVNDVIGRVADKWTMLILEVLAESQDIANAVLAMARTSLLHADFPGRLCKEGNMAFPFSPSDIPLGELYRFSIFHVVAPDDPYEMFPIDYERVG